MISLIRITPALFSKYEAGIVEIEKLSFPSPWSSKLFKDETKNPLSTLWVLKESEQIVGYICFWIIKDQIHLLNIAVHPSRRREGFATLMLNKMIQKGIDLGVKEIWLEVRPSNGAAIKLYEKQGFQVKGRRQKYYTDTGEDALVMALRISEESGPRKFNMPLA